MEFKSYGFYFHFHVGTFGLYVLGCVVASFVLGLGPGCWIEIFGLGLMSGGRG